MLGVYSADGDEDEGEDEDEDAFEYDESLEEYDRMVDTRARSAPPLVQDQRS